MPNRFHNPYNFVPTPPRNGYTGFMGDGAPEGAVHERLDAARWTGTIPVELEVVTPLVLPRPEPISEREGHRTYDVFDAPEPSALRGLLRSAYETITNSRFGVFRTPRQGYRRNARGGPNVKPALLSREAHGWQLDVFPDVAWVHCKDCRDGLAVLPSESSMPSGTYLYAVVFRVQRRRFDGRRGGRWINTIQHWQVLSFSCDRREAEKQLRAARLPANFPTDAAPPPGRRRPRTWHYACGPVDFKLVEGYLYRTGKKNMPGKHDERIFIAPAEITFDEQGQLRRLVKDYEDLINDYWAQHPEEEPTQSAHIADKFHTRKDRYNVPRMEGSGVLLYAEMNERIPARLMPVAISRSLHDCAPLDVLERTGLAPGQSAGQMSPADRLFGMAGADDAFAARLRVVSAPSAETPAAERFQDALPLAVLGVPKPGYGKFYVAERDDGSPFPNGRSKESSTLKGSRGIRGRKWYWHHRDREAYDAYWKSPRRFYNPEKGEHDPDPQECHNLGAQKRDDNHQYHDNARSKHNRSITGWIEPGSKYRFEVHVRNLSDEELGALLWLLSLADRQEGYCLRLGYGKPLGFGSVRLRLAVRDGEAVPVATGARWARYYRTLSAETAPQTDRQELKIDDKIRAFQRAVLAGCGQEIDPHGDPAPAFDQLPFIRQFLQILRGPNDDLPIHYPRRTRHRNPEGKQYEWFVQNERGEKYALPLPSEDRGLPYDPS